MTLLNKTQITIKIDKNIKKTAQKVAEEIDISLEDLVISYLKQLVFTKQVTLSASNRPSAYLRSIIKEAQKNSSKLCDSPK
ncbi:MAG: hypothetical protein AAB629_01840 [Patescibacteria group bacterium]